MPLINHKGLRHFRAVLSKNLISKIRLQVFVEVSLKSKPQADKDAARAVDPHGNFHKSRGKSSVLST